jgi:hypothetical protein
MSKEINAKVIFDNGGGITLQLGDWAHWYNDADQAAEDYHNYITDGSTEGWDGHEDDAAELDPTNDDIRNGGYRILYCPEDIDLLDPDNSWGNIMDFCAALKKMGE